MTNSTFIFDPNEFVREEFAEECAACFDEYMRLRIIGTPRDIAVIDSFNMFDVGAAIHNALELAFAIERNPYFKENFFQRLEEAKPTEMWTANRSIHHLLCIIEDPFTRVNFKIAAIRDLNLLCGITVIDENGLMRPGRRLEDFYANERAAEFKGHPMPGTKEATDFMAATRKVALLSQ